MKQLLTLFIAAFLWHGAEAQIITTVAGGGTGGLGDGGTATACELDQPAGVAADASGNIYIGDRNNNRIRKVSTSGAVTTIAGIGIAGYTGDNGPATNAAIYPPCGVAADNEGNVFFAEGVVNGHVRKISASGIITTVAGGWSASPGDGGPATAAILAPYGVAVDMAGNIYIADGTNYRVRKVNTAGIISTIAGTGVSGYSGDGGPATAAKIRMAYCIAVDAAGNVYVGEEDGARVRKISTSGIINTIAGTGAYGYESDGIPAIYAKLSYPRGVAIDASGNIYIADASNNRIRKVDASGKIWTVAGTGAPGFYGDGGAVPEDGAQLWGPGGIAVRGSTLYISDSRNDRIRMVTNIVGIDETLNDNPEVGLFPDPSSGDFTIDMSSLPAETCTILITDMQGRVLYERKEIAGRQIPIQLNVPTGLYMLTATANGMHITKKISIVK